MADTNEMTKPMSAEQEQRAKWDLLLADIESRYEQLRLTRQFNPWPVVFAGLATGAGIFLAGVAFCKLLGR